MAQKEHKRRRDGRSGRGSHAVMLLYLFLSSLSGSLLASEECQGELLEIHCNNQSHIG